ncbi:hypothetical protein D1P53_005853 [Cryptococcus gattii VGV]|nr:hypothetical protein D1P53_005853 [Cryptococcus gattii VGV]
MSLWSATLENFSPNKLYFKVRPLIDTVCTTDTDVAIWLRILGSLTRDLIAKELTLDRVLCALYLRGLPLQVDTSIPSPLSCQMFDTLNPFGFKLTSNDLRVATYPSPYPQR